MSSLMVDFLSSQKLLTAIFFQSWFYHQVSIVRILGHTIDFSFKRKSTLSSFSQYLDHSAVRLL